MKIPGAERAIVADAKVRDYLLSTEHRVGRGKARFFAQLGFEKESWEALQEQLVHLASRDAELGEKTRFGQKYVVRDIIQGPEGRSALVVAVWIVLEGEEFPRLITAYPGAE